MMQGVKAVVRRVHEDEQGAEGLEKLLIVAAVILPLLGLLLFFRDDLSDWVKGAWDDVKGDAEDFGQVP